MNTLPPVTLLDVPDAMVRSPPTAPVPDPTVTYTAPPLPADLEAPDPMYNAPVLPLLDVPVLKTIIPDTPVVPALAVAINKSPLEVALPYPVVK